MNLQARRGGRRRLPPERPEDVFDCIKAPREEREAICDHLHLWGNPYKCCSNERSEKSYKSFKI